MHIHLGLLATSLSIGSAFLLGPSMLASRQRVSTHQFETSKIIPRLPERGPRCTIAPGPAASSGLKFGKQIVVPPSETATATVIWLHGLGDTGGGWSKLSQALAIPWVKFIFPTAPMQPCTLCGGSSVNAWYDIAGVSKVSELRSDPQGLQASSDYIQTIIQAEIDAGVPSERIMLAGFSQGGCVALAAALQCGRPLAGVMGLSTTFPRGVADQPNPGALLMQNVAMKDCANGKLPVLICHGEEDPIVKVQQLRGGSGTQVEWGRKGFEYLRDLGLPTQGNIYPGMGHEFAAEELPDMRNFIFKCLPPLFKAALPKPLGMVLEERGGGSVGVASLKPGGNAESSGLIKAGDVLLRINGASVRDAGFDRVMEILAASPSPVEVEVVRPIPDRDVDWASLSDAERERRFESTGGIIRVCTDAACRKQGSKATIRWLTELTPASFSVSKCSCTGSCGNGPNVVLSGKGRQEKVIYGITSVGSAVKMLREEFSLQPDPDVVQAILNPSKNSEFGLSDELVRQGLLATVTVRGSYETNRF